ncbi:RNA polymerase, sigma-24 subunit, ECF subfamily [Geobacter metallireducens RCH3]|uniref:RNA polymerase sigma-24 factor, putative n=1 Tax=Geobacter metallireducens (strain ATCC 53774 / DSM 7210 / GS-15) TaxID=269799 RepID=Q39SE3_GEOMG|nr:RNA polymerase sigma factor [Geobacter metallireducens]ABB32831.1 RNA polymerase sigma-24 factor, putative [Geobacter metallireducens GS-15]EHP89036.1 RNA polymerase, sigma-24 subunit, ECF subfamily [Geobacter metallireducens RCH3]
MRIKEERLDSTEILNRFLAGIERRAFRMARLATSDDDEALDLVHDAMLAFVNRYAGKPEGEWAPLFHRTLQNRIVDWHRRTGVRNRFRAWFLGGESEEESDPLENVADLSSPDPLASLQRHDLGEAIESAVRRLPLRQRQAFLLRAWEGLDTAQTAFAMGCSEGSVKTHYSRAVHTLRDYLEEYAP